MGSGAAQDCQVPHVTLGAPPPFSRGSPRFTRKSRDASVELQRISLQVAKRIGKSSPQTAWPSEFIPASRLRMVRNIAQGTYGTVQLAELLPAPGSREPARKVAVKRLRTVAIAADEVAALVAEASLLMKVEHSAIIRVLGTGCDSQVNGTEWTSMFVVEEYADGGSIKQLLMKQMVRPHAVLYSLLDALRWSTQMAEGLDCLHHFTPRIIHRDLKSDNVVLRTAPDGKLNAVICDLGLHRAAEPAQRSTSSKDRGQEDSLKYCLTGCTGSYCYMAPEVFGCKPYNCAVDVFSFGMIMYELFHRQCIHSFLMSGTALSLGINDDQDLAAMVAAGYRMPISQELPPELRVLISRCMSGLPELRPSMAEALQTLRQVEASGAMAKLDAAADAPPALSCCAIM